MGLGGAPGLAHKGSWAEQLTSTHAGTQDSKQLEGFSLCIFKVMWHKFRTAMSFR